MAKIKVTSSDITHFNYAEFAIIKKVNKIAIQQMIVLQEVENKKLFKVI